MNDYVNRNRQGYDVDAALVPAATITTTANGDGVYIGENVDLDVVLQVRGTVSGTTPTLDVTLEESDDNSSFTAIPGAAFTQATATGVNERIKCLTTKSYVRAVKTVGGTTPSFGDTEVFIAS